jgi:hypothetical protein
MWIIWGKTPLILLTERDNKESVKFMLENGANAGFKIAVWTRDAKSFAKNKEMKELISSYSKKVEKAEDPVLISKENNFNDNDEIDATGNNNNSDDNIVM